MHQLRIAVGINFNHQITVSPNLFSGDDEGYSSTDRSAIQPITIKIHLNNVMFTNGESPCPHIVIIVFILRNVVVCVSNIVNYKCYNITLYKLETGQINQAVRRVGIPWWHNSCHLIGKDICFLLNPHRVGDKHGGGTWWMISPVYVIPISLF